MPASTLTAFLEIDVRGVNSGDVPVSAGWNLLDMAGVPSARQHDRVGIRALALSSCLFPDYQNSKTQIAVAGSELIRKSIESLLWLNCQLPPDIQANIFCLKEMLTDESWRGLVVSKLPRGHQKWWEQIYPAIVRKHKGVSSWGPIFARLDLLQSQAHTRAIFGASQNTLRWEDIVEQGKILLVSLNSDGSDLDGVISNLVLAEMAMVFRERSPGRGKGNVRPYHLFLDDFQSYANYTADQVEAFAREYRKVGAKTHLIHQNPSALSARAKKFIMSNRTHVIVGALAGTQTSA